MSPTSRREYMMRITELRERCAFYEQQNAEQGKMMNAAIAEREIGRASCRERV